MAFGAKVRRGLLVPRCVPEQQFGNGINDQIGYEQRERSRSPDNDDGEHGPKRNEEEIEEPSDAGCKDADHGEQTDDAEDECADKDSLGKRHIGRFNAGEKWLFCFVPGGAVECGFAVFQDLKDGVYARFDAAVIVPGLEPGRHDISNDASCQRIGERSLEPVPHLDAHAAVLRGHDEQDAVVLAFLTELPFLENRFRISFDALPFERGYGEHRDLVAGAVFMRLEPFRERFAHGRGQDLRVVGHTAGKVRDVRGSSAKRRKDYRENECVSQDCSHEPFSSMMTFGSSFSRAAPAAVAARCSSNP